VPWSFLLTDHAGVNLAELTTAAGRRLTFRRNTYAEATCTIAHEDDAAARLLDALANAGIPALKAYRDGVLRFNGQLAPFTEEAEEASALHLVFRSPFARLLGDGSGTGRFTAAAVAFTATDAGLIAKSLIDTTNTDSPTGIATTAGGITASKTRDRTYQHANVGKAIIDLSAVLDGYDFYETFVDEGATRAYFNAVPRQGVDQPSARFEYGADTLGNVRSVQRATQPPVNVVTVIGGNGLIAQKSDATSILKYGRWPAQASYTDVIEQATLDDKALALLRPDPIKTVTFAPEPALAPSPWDDFWLGDTIRLYVRREAFTEDVQVRVNGITVAIDDSGLEVFEVQDPQAPGEEAALRASLAVEVV